MLGVIGAAAASKAALQGGYSVGKQVKSGIKGIEKNLTKYDKYLKEKEKATKKAEKEKTAKNVAKTNTTSNAAKTNRTPKTKKTNTTPKVAKTNGVPKVKKANTTPKSDAKVLNKMGLKPSDVK